MRFKKKKSLFGLLAITSIYIVGHILIQYHVYKESNRPRAAAAMILAGKSPVYTGERLLADGLKNADNLESSHHDNQVSQLRTQVMTGLGDMGKPAIMDMETDHNKYEKQVLFDYSGFNLFLSDRISLNRTLPDVRSKGCAALHYPNILPKTSVVIIFHDEPWSTLWRTVHSVINRSPPCMQEIVLVNDASTIVDLLPSRLDDYTKKLNFNIKLLHMETRVGSVTARNLGMAEATGEVLVILDSHCEVTKGWLEPLVYGVVQNRTRIVTPVVDTIHPDTFEYMWSDLRYVGGIQWGLDYMWQLMQRRDIQELERNETLPKRTPTIGGGLFAIDKALWNKLGGFDDGFKIWGGDNLELSFKAWMCGGSMEISPCSRVGHLSRARSAYPYFADNQKRLAEVWIDDQYKEFFYFYNPQIKKADAGDISERIALRKRLKCKSFGWYIENVFPWSSLPNKDPALYGMVKHLESGLCLDNHMAVNKTRQPDDALKTYHCGQLNFNQIWLFNKRGEIRHNDKCIDSKYVYRTLKMCNNGDLYQKWTYDNKTRHISRNDQCLDFKGSLEDVVYVNACNASSFTQKWVMDMKQWQITSPDNQ